MKPDDSFAQVMTRLNAGDSAAAAQVVQRFTHRLIALARLRLDARVRQKKGAPAGEHDDKWILGEIELEVVGSTR
jgi:hypothetical protein